MNRIDLRELECFVAVADHLNFSKAARQLNLSQPPLTRHVQSLEEKLGTRLFNRNTHAVALTDAGALFLEDAAAILRHLDRATESIQRARQGETTRLRLAFVGALLDDKLVCLIQKVREAHPEYQVEMTDLSPAAQLAAIQAGRARRRVYRCSAEEDHQRAGVAGLEPRAPSAGRAGKAPLGQGASIVLARSERIAMGHGYLIRPLRPFVSSFLNSKRSMGSRRESFRYRIESPPS